MWWTVLYYERKSSKNINSWEFRFMGISQTWLKKNRFNTVFHFKNVCSLWLDEQLFMLIKYSWLAFTWEHSILSYVMLVIQQEALYSFRILYFTVCHNYTLLSLLTCLPLSLSPGSVSQNLSSVKVVTAEMLSPSPSTNHRPQPLTPGNYSNQLELRPSSRSVLYHEPVRGVGLDSSCQLFLHVVWPDDLSVSQW